LSSPWFSALFVSFALLVSHSFGQIEPKTQPERKLAFDPRRALQPIDDPDWMFEVLEKVREKYGLSEISAAVVIRDRVVAASIAGRRKIDDPTPLNRNDRVKIGSVSKPVTATLIGVLMEAQMLSFGDSLEKMFPDLKDSMRAEYRKVTIPQLLSHTSGMPYQPSKSESHERFLDLSKAMDNRYAYVKNALADPPESVPGKKFLYGGSGNCCQLCRTVDQETH
jgi:CubicO group peptidase (beta-lactamase class C family)